MNQKILSLLVYFLINPALAEWVPNTDADVALERSDSVISVQNDGSYTMTDDRIFVARNEKGRNNLALEKIPFNPSSTQAEILKASSVTDGVETPVDLKTIQERGAAGPEQGLTGNKELVIPFTNLKIGSKIKYQVRYKSKTVAMPGFFTMSFVYGLQFPELSGSVHIRSTRKLNYAVADDQRHLDVLESAEGNLSVLTIRMLKPFDKQLKEENGPILNKKSFPQVQVSTATTWNQLARDIAAKYDVILSEELPPVFLSIVEKANKKKTLYEKIDAVTSELATIMTYSGNWTTVDKMFYPKGHAQVAASKTGDCKDFATTTTAILRKMKIKANVALVFRKNPYDPLQKLQSGPLKPDFASLSIFNHAIVRVETPEKKILWVDPTNPVSNSRMAFADIADSYALNVYAGTQDIEKVPVPNAELSALRIDKKIKILGDETAETSGNLHATGFFAAETLQTAFLGGKEKADEMVTALFGNMTKEAQRNVVSRQNYKSRIADEFDAQITTSNEKIFVEKDKKKLVVVPFLKQLQVYALAHSAGGRSTDFYALPKSQVYASYKIEGYDFEDSKSMGCVALSPWFEVERKLFKTPSGFEVQDKISFKKEFMTAKEINSDEFGMSLEDLNACGNAQLIEVKKLDENSSLDTRLSRFTLDNIKTLNKFPGPSQSAKALEAKMIADQLLLKDPKNNEIQVELAKSYESLGYRKGSQFDSFYLAKASEIVDQILLSKSSYLPALREKTYLLINSKKLAEAKTYFSKAYYATDKKDFLIFELGGYLTKADGQYQLAIGSYNKALELAETEAQKAKTYKRLGNIYEILKDHPKTEEYYNLALKIEPQNAWLMNDLLVLHLEQRQFDKAISVGEKMLEISDFGMGRSNLSTAYGGKAQDLLSQKKGNFLEEASQVAMKGLKWHPCFNCLAVLGDVYLEQAKMQNDPALIQKSIDTWEKAAKMDNPEAIFMPPVHISMARQALVVIQKNKEKERMPASLPNSRLPKSP